MSGGPDHGFCQEPPRLGDPYAEDEVLRGYLRRVLPGDLLEQLEPELEEMARLAVELYHRSLEDRLHEPEHIPYDPWGRHVDEIRVTAVWQAAERIAAEKGLVATGYEERFGRWARVAQFALVYLFTPSSDLYSCPLAMTDGAAGTLRRTASEELRQRAVPQLLSRDPKEFWTSGQWMTETAGGSDVGRSETIARQDADGTWRLWGRKWFTSAVNSQMALTLARPEVDGATTPGGRGLALFYVETRDQEGLPNRLRVARLKDKLGTRKLPTAELLLEGTPAIPVSGLERGVKHITPMLNITRTWNAVSSASFLRRGLALAWDYAGRRVAFGAPILEQPLHRDTLEGLAAETAGAFHLTFRTVELLGLVEAEEASPEEERLLRLLTPLAKLTTAKQSVAGCSEVLEAFGGAGYVEDTGLPSLLRDAQVLPIWEGTTNVLSLDLLRALQETGGLGPIAAELDRCLADSPDLLIGPAAVAREAFEAASRWLREHQDRPSNLQAGARRLALTLGRTLELALLIQQAAWSLAQGDPLPVTTAQRFADEGVSRLHG
ncbi:MAG: acyl-CoA dehydrogenase family protein [Acidobacteriota bacterium]|nr:acyl-CoA dehydrogenase family protein [Acidobacteriota bacterium]